MAKCTLCGGKLNMKKRCTLCGLDNSKSDAMYRSMINRNNCDGAPLTHVHEEPKQKAKVPTYKSVEKTSAGNTPTHTAAVYNKTTRNKNSGKAVLALLPTIIILIGSIVSIFGSIMDSSDEIYYEDTFVGTEEFIVTDDAFVCTLEEGYYIVGSDIPEGTYDIYVEDGSNYIDIYDEYGEMYFFNFLTQGDSFQLDLYDEMELVIPDDIVLTFTCYE